MENSSMKEYIYKIIKDLGPKKANRHDMISIRMLKHCGISIEGDIQCIKISSSFFSPNLRCYFMTTCVHFFRKRPNIATTFWI